MVIHGKSIRCALALKRKCQTYDGFEPSGLSMRILSWAQHHFSTICHLDSCCYASDPYGSVSQVIALGEAYTCIDNGKDAFGTLKQFCDTHHDWIFGFLSYDLKNQVEKLSSHNHDGIGTPDMHFFVPEVVINIHQGSFTVCCLPDLQNYDHPDKVVRAFSEYKTDCQQVNNIINIKSRVGEDRYIRQVRAIKEHIQKGDIYEMNYCIEFFDDQAWIDPLFTYHNLIGVSPTPFSCFYSLNGISLMCASPERFLKKTGRTMVSQPIKGTAARGYDIAEDKRQIDRLLLDPKERSENVMIVDLVRNDLSRTAKDGSVQVKELCGIYPFSHVHQMISTVVSELDEHFHPIDAIRYAFPMGSMTGAPKIRAMELIEQYEDTKRGLYSGSVGYISPEKDFDFNVVIRSILYNASNHYLSYLAGSAITAGSIPEREYEECLLKAEGMRKAVTWLR